LLQEKFKTKTIPIVTLIGYIRNKSLSDLTTLTPSSYKE